MKGRDVHAMKNEEIVLEGRNLRTKLFDLRTQAVTAKVEDTSQFRKTRRDIARLLTELHERRRSAKARG
jgi:large subunit ribosomal protein L29